MLRRTCTFLILTTLAGTTVALTAGASAQAAPGSGARGLPVSIPLPNGFRPASISQATNFSRDRNPDEKVAL